MKSLDNAFQLRHCLVSCEVNHSRASPHKIRWKAASINFHPFQLPRAGRSRHSISHRVAHSPEGVKLWDLETFWKVKIWMDMKILITKSCDIGDALELFHGLVDLFFYVDLYIFVWPSFLFLFLIMVYLWTVHIVLGSDGNLESGSFL